MPTQLVRLETRLYYTYWSGKVSATHIMADQAVGYQMMREANETASGLIVELDAQVTIPIDFRLVRVVLAGMQAPLFVVIIGASSAIKTLADTIQKMFVKTAFVYYADDLNCAIVLARQLLIQDESTKGQPQT